MSRRSGPWLLLLLAAALLCAAAASAAGTAGALAPRERRVQRHSAAEALSKRLRADRQRASAMRMRLAQQRQGQRVRARMHAGVRARVRLVGATLQHADGKTRGWVRHSLK